MAKEMICNVDECCNMAAVRGMCNPHYLRNKRHGSPLAGGPAKNRGRKCSVEGCEKSHASGGYCAMHLRRVKRHGSAEGFDKDYRCNEKWIDAHKDYQWDDCVKWPFYVGENGRGMIGRGVKRMSAPRAMCIAAHGNPEDESMEAAHSCGNGHLGCMNPRHLRWATHMENVKDRAEHGRDRMGTQINTNKLTESQVIEIRGRKGKQSGLSLASEFGVSASNISDILRGNSWKFLL